MITANMLSVERTIRELKQKIKNIDLDVLRFLRDNFTIDYYPNDTCIHFNGIAYKNVLLEPQRLKMDFMSFVSHAHSDHLPTGGHGSILSSEITWRFSKRGPLIKDIPDNIELLPAGHVPGATMLYIEDELNVLYTGDFSLHDTSLFMAAEPRKADIVFLDATYGAPDYTFPEREEEKTRLLEAIDYFERVNVLTYTFGKPQEILTYLREHYGKGFEEDVYLSRSIFKKTYIIGDLMRSAGIDVYSFSQNPKRASIMITNRAILDPTRVTITVSGFWRAEGDYHFYLSSHEDYNGLLEFLRKCEPRLIVTLWGPEGSERNLSRDLEIPALSFNELIALLTVLRYPLI
ncbi:MAG: hypothetical protein J7J27_05935 [Euryarchaeota archaeon]|nr:hypothetical protein [Euryarchaeota archaeon]